MRLAILSVVLFLSGISALIFETLWLRLSGLAFGNSIWAAALILSSFMAGLALGTAMAASAKFRARPLKLYAALEIAVAVFGCTIVFALPVLGELLRPVFQALWNHQSILLEFRVLISFVILLIPTTAMGITLPVVLEDRQLVTTDFGKAIGLLYGLNTIGAVCGALIGELVLIKAFGLFGTSVVAGALNCVAAIIALFLARSNSVESTSSERPRRLRLKIDYQLPWRLLIVSFGAGSVLLALEVIWFRFLRLYVASSATAFSVMLAVVLAGIGLGGVLSGAISRRIRQSALPILLLIAASLTLVCYIFFPIPKLAEGEKNFYLEAWSQIALISLALMFPVAFLSGILFPAIAARVQESVGSRMNSVGLTTLFNTAGAAIGPILAGFVLLPRVGFQTSLIICAVVYGTLSLIVGQFVDWSPRRLSGLIRGVCVFAFGFAVFPVHRDEMHFANARKLYESEEQHLVKKIEGETGTWQLLRRDLFGRPYYYRLLTDGFSMSATNPVNQRYMRLFAYLPLTLHPKPENALLIAFGCGVTADALTHDVDLQHIDVVDVSKEAFALADDYRDAGYSNALRDSRVSAIVQDGRFFLQASPLRYDIITGEPPPPKVLGSVNLYTEQFFKLMSDRLNDGGIATFWLPIYQLNVEEAKSILRAFHDAFPNTLIWSSADEEWIMMGIKGEPRKIDNRQLRKLWDYSNPREDLARIGVEVPEQLPALFVMDGGEIDRIAKDAKPLTDFFPKRLGEVTAVDPAIHEFTGGYMHASELVRRFRSSRLIQQIFPDEVLNAQLEPFFVIREMRYHARLSETNWLKELDIHLRGSRLREPVLECLDSNEFRVALAKEATERAADESQELPVQVLDDFIADALASRDYPKAIHLLEDLRARTGVTPKDNFLLTYLFCLTGDVTMAESVAAVQTNQDPLFEKWLWGKLQAEYGFHPPDN
jgi:spermidine synthase